MSHINWNKKKIPRPDGSYVNHSDGCVFIITDTGGKYKKRQVIGHATSDTMMHPNDLFRFLYPQFWWEHYEDSELPEHQLKAGCTLLFWE